MNQSGEEHASKIKEKEGIYDILDEHFPREVQHRSLTHESFIKQL